MITEQKLTTAECVSRLLESNLHFRVAVTFDELTQVLAGFETYNGIPDDLREIGGAIREAVGPMQFAPGNPNNGSFDHIRVSIGNESSLVIYVMVPCAYLQGRETRVHSALQSLGARFEADECTAEVSAHSINLRLWWD